MAMIKDVIQRKTSEDVYKFEEKELSNSKLV